MWNLDEQARLGVCQVYPLPIVCVSCRIYSLYILDVPPTPHGGSELGAIGERDGREVQSLILSNNSRSSVVSWRSSDFDFPITALMQCPLIQALKASHSYSSDVVVPWFKSKYSIMRYRRVSLNFSIFQPKWGEAPRVEGSKGVIPC